MAQNGFKNVAIQKISIRYVILGAAVIGTLQASTWIVLSLISILYYNSAIQISDDLSEQDYSFWIYTLYLQKNIKIKNFIIYPVSFNIFMYFYVVLSSIWLIISCYILWAMIRDKWYHVKVSMVAWAAITFAIAALDIILMSLIAADLKTAHDLFKIPTIMSTTAATTTAATTTAATTTAATTTAATTTATTTTTTTATTTTTLTTIDTSTPSSVSESVPSEFVILKYFILSTLDLETPRNIAIDPSLVNTFYTAMGIIMSSAARGYILWIVNVACASIFIMLVYKMNEQEENSMLPIIDAYAAGQRPFSLYDSTDIGTGNWNNGFQPDGSIIFSPGRRNPLSNNGLGNEDSTPENYDIFRPHEAPGISPATPDRHSRATEAVPAGPRLAKIGKSTPGRRTPPQSVPAPHVPQMPYIPPPDYTPPGSPVSKPRSVLRPQSNYVL